MRRRKSATVIEQLETLGWGTCLQLMRKLKRPPLRQAELARRAGLTLSKTRRIEQGEIEGTRSEREALVKALSG